MREQITVEMGVWEDGRAGARMGGQADGLTIEGTVGQSI